MTKIVIKWHENPSKNDFSHLFDMADWGGFVSFVAGRAVVIPAAEMTRAMPLAFND